MPKCAYKLCSGNGLISVIELTHEDEKYLPEYPRSMPVASLFSAIERGFNVEWHTLFCQCRTTEGRPATGGWIKFYADVFKKPQIEFEKTRVTYSEDLGLCVTAYRLHRLNYHSDSDLNKIKEIANKTVSQLRTFTLNERRHSATN